LCRGNVAPLTEARPVQPTVATRFSLSHAAVRFLKGELCAANGLASESFTVLLCADTGLEFREPTFFLFDSCPELLTDSLLLTPRFILSLLGQVLLAFSPALFTFTSLSLSLPTFIDLASEELELFALSNFLAATVVLTTSLFVLSQPHPSCGGVFFLGSAFFLGMLPALLLTLLPVLFLALASGLFSKALSAVESGLFS
jgi:hypothetical protein